LKTACQQKIAQELLPALQAAIGSKIRRGEKWDVRPDEDDPDKQTLLFEYPTSFAPNAAGYIRRVVKIEMGARADHWPCETKTVMPYVAEQFPQGFRAVNCALKALSVERTFWEKATILHSEYFRPVDKPSPARLSRHYCDFHELIRKGVAKQATDQLELLKRVSEHKGLFFKSSWAKYDEAAKGTLRIAPPEHRMKAMREDYARMQEMFFGQPPLFDPMMNALKQWELQFNQK